MLFVVIKNVSLTSSFFHIVQKKIISAHPKTQNQQARVEKSVLSPITSPPGAINKVNISHRMINTTIICYWKLAGLAYPPVALANEATYF